MSPRARIPEQRVRGLWRRVAGQLGMAALLGLAAALGLLLLAAWLLGTSPLWQRPSVAPLLLWLAVTALGLEWSRRLAIRGRAWTRRAAAAEIEGRLGLPRGSVQGAVEHDVERPGVSKALIELHRERVGGRLAATRVGQLGSRTAREARGSALAAGVAALLVALGVAAVWLGERDSARRAWAALSHPVGYLSHPPLPAIAVLADSTRVRRGGDLAVRVEAPRRDSVLLYYRPQGDVAHRSWRRLERDRAEAVVPRVEAPTAVWAVAPDGAVSDTLRIEPVDPLLLVDAQLDLRYPPHTRREREVLGAPFGPMTVPAGTRAMLSGAATRALRRAALGSPDRGAIALQITQERRFQGSFAVRGGTWGWELEGARGEPLEGRPDSLEFRILPDSAPAVYVLYPGADTVMPLSMVQNLVIEMRDDYGLSGAELVSWRVSTWGERWPAQLETLPLPDDGARANLAATLDATGRGFLPGDTLHYYVRAFDNNPARQEGRSEEYVLRLPTLDEVRERTVAEANELVESAKGLAERARDQQQATESLQRSLEVQPAPGEPQRGGGNRTPQSLEFSQTQAARQSLEQAEALAEQAKQIEQSLRQLQESVERAGLNDSSLVQRLREIESLYQRVITPELQERIEEMRQALGTLDPERIQEMIQRLAEGSAEFRQRVEQTLELLRRAALEQEFTALEAQAEELAKSEERLDQTLRGTQPGDSAAGRLGARAEELGRQSEELARRIDELTGKLQAQGEETAAEHSGEAGQQAEVASRSNQQAARSLPRDAGSAAEAARRGREQLQQAASSLRQGREGMQQNWRSQVTEAMSRAQAEALELARRQEQLNESASGETGRGDEARERSEQAALRRGVDQIQEQLAQASRSTLLMDPELLQAAAAAGAAMDELLGDMSSPGGGGQRRTKLGEAATTGLNDLAYRLMQAQDAAASSASGTGLQEALQRLSELAEQQGRLSSQTGGALPVPIGDALTQTLQRLAGQQRAIGDELERLGRSLGPRGQVLGRLDQMGEEAQELAEELERGRLDQELVDRQRRLFRRLLDAGRSLEQDEFQRERQAERPTGAELFRPGELPPELLRGLRFPHPENERLKDYPPALRRLILEYFDLLNQRGGPDGT